jgi:guanylate kinase
LTQTAGGLFIVSAPSGGGKTSLTREAVRRLAAQGARTEISVSYTTRAARPGEQDGVHYHFIDEPRFQAMIDAGEFLEHAEVFGRRYGTGRSRTEALLAQGCDVILDIDWQGARQVRMTHPEAIGIFILPPSLAELERRLRSRGQDDETTVQRRMAAAQAEMRHYDEYDYLIINEDFERALGELQALFTARRLTRPRQAIRHAALIAGLLSPGA